MKRLLLTAIILSGFSAHAGTLYSKPAETKWNVTADGASVGVVTLLSNGSSVRAEWKTSPSSPAVTYLGSGGKVWLKAAGGDVELSATSGSGADRLIVPALLLPSTISPKTKVTSAGGKVSAYSYTVKSPVKATYKHDASGVSEVVVVAAGKTYKLTRSAFAAKAHDASLFTLRPKKTASSRMASLAGDLLGPSDASVSATAGGRGVERGAEFADGGDYAALALLEARDRQWSANLDAALEEFQRTGSVGSARGDQ